MKTASRWRFTSRVVAGLEDHRDGPHSGDEEIVEFVNARAVGFVLKDATFV